MKRSGNTLTKVLLAILGTTIIAGLVVAFFAGVFKLADYLDKTNNEAKSNAHTTAATNVSNDGSFDVESIPFKGYRILKFTLEGHEYWYRDGLVHSASCKKCNSKVAK